MHDMRSQRTDRCVETGVDASEDTLHQISFAPKAFLGLWSHDERADGLNGGARKNTMSETRVLFPNKTYESMARVTSTSSNRVQEFVLAVS